MTQRDYMDELREHAAAMPLAKQIMDERFGPGWRDLQMLRSPEWEDACAEARKVMAMRACRAAAAEEARTASSVGIAAGDEPNKPNNPGEA